ncbi:unnamed protein product [Angiostrongylus costaricensis]|uniref:ANF_receptor domain-containing protein n=1 Tax=Angiostrongylus costaricensis TaxID=334426 RepID=A0A0R3PKR4_ANGCS|nr:unnamed protein product [Angiostrongylus costaricensis]
MVREVLAQMRGLAMGQRLAPSLGIEFMSNVEAPVIDLSPLLYHLSTSVQQTRGAIFFIYAQADATADFAFLRAWKGQVDSNPFGQTPP